MPATPLPAPSGASSGIPPAPAPPAQPRVRRPRAGGGAAGRPRQRAHGGAEPSRPVQAARNGPSHVFMCGRRVRDPRIPPRPFGCRARAPRDRRSGGSATSAVRSAWVPVRVLDQRQGILSCCSQRWKGFSLSIACRVKWTCVSCTF